MSLLHFKAIGISPECLVCLESVIHLPCHDNIFTLLIVIDGKRVKLYLEFNDFLECLRESDFHDSLLITTWNWWSTIRVIISDGPLIDEISFLEHHILVKFAVLKRQWLVKHWPKDVSALFHQKIDLLRFGEIFIFMFLQFYEGSVYIPLFPMTCDIFFEIDAK